MEQSVQIVEEWYSIDAETKMNEKIDKLQSMVNEQSQTIQILLNEIKHLKQEVHSSHNVSTNQNDRTHQLYTILLQFEWIDPYCIYIR